MEKPWGIRKMTAVTEFVFRAQPERQIVPEITVRREAGDCCWVESPGAWILIRPW
jgi:hypothetical protein